MFTRLSEVGRGPEGFPRGFPNDMLIKLVTYVLDRQSYEGSRKIDPKVPPQQLRLRLAKTGFGHSPALPSSDAQAPQPSL